MPLSVSPLRTRYVVPAGFPEAPAEEPAEGDGDGGSADADDPADGSALGDDGSLAAGVESPGMAEPPDAPGPGDATSITLNDAGGSPDVPGVTREITSSRNATTINATRIACPLPRPAVPGTPARPARTGSSDRTAPRVSGHRPPSAPARVSAATSRAAWYVAQPRCVGMRHSSRCLDRARGDAGAVAVHRCSRFGWPLRHPPFAASRYGQPSRTGSVVELAARGQEGVRRRLVSPGVAVIAGEDSARGPA